MQSAIWSRATPLVLALTVVAASGVHAQSDDEANGGVLFNFSTPGARSLAMGGAFLGSVDDATAAYSNPAGLLQLSEPEVSIEGRRWALATPFADRGRASGVPTGIGVDTLSGIEFGTAVAELDGASFASFAYPRPKWTFAFYFHQVAQFRADFATGGIFADEGEDIRRLFPIQSTYDLDISQTGVAFAHKWGSFAAGFGVSLYSLELRSLTQRYAGELFGPENFRDDLRVNFQSQTGDSDEVGANFGLRWNLGKKATVGAVYRWGPAFDINVLSAAPSPEIPPAQRRVFEDETATFNLPDVFGVGLSLRPTQSVTLNFDVNRVRYSQLVKEFFVFFEDDGPDRVTPEDFKIDDVTEIHLGFEYVLAKGPIPIAIRLGGWYDPDHRLRLEAGSTLNQARFFAGEDVIHYTGGLGIVITSHFQIDAAVDFSDNADTTALSAVYRF